MRVVISLGGSVLAPDLDPDRVRDHASAIDRLRAGGCDPGVVVGGGSAAREYIGAARELGANDVDLDRLGIGVTRLNARLLIAALGRAGSPVPIVEYDEAELALRRDEVPVMGGTEPGHTTDAVATTLAEYVDADLLVFATGADGVYSADPNIDPNAEKYESLTPSELVDVIAPMTRKAGASAPVDLLAAKLLQRSSTRAIVLDGNDPDGIARAVLEGEHTGTDVVPDPDDEPIESEGESTEPEDESTEIGSQTE